MMGKLFESEALFKKSTETLMDGCFVVLEHKVPRNTWFRDPRFECFALHVTPQCSFPFAKRNLADFADFARPWRCFEKQRRR